MRPSTTVVAVYGLALMASTGVSGVHAATCSQDMLSAQNTFVQGQKTLFQSCLNDLKISTQPSSNDAWMSFVSDDYLSGSKADAICATDNCVRALIAVMETLPDCCSQSSSGVRNLPRLADDILHQCDIRDARKLAEELEEEIKKLPDLKVQIQSLQRLDAHSSSSSSTAGTSVGDGVDVIIDVKKREMMKTGGYGLVQSEKQSGNAGGADSAAISSVASVSSLVLALGMAIQFLL
ncbi:hypothetical protein Poli38472_012639 [Pythium oligandrum]|uniref:Elicitin-like protein n=1 Tax=Pythium oligandrum TaxID=41045 RepID=A0A8K1CF77_PYTOL|nr:hypothetical protein Poli38472_012639 [Pythium oligandrum]|eukprot:TMW61448.1 hypothetical protein Poli38472_012639 [Pythium oligandrum]